MSYSRMFKELLDRQAKSQAKERDRVGEQSLARIEKAGRRRMRPIR